jgi:hypothetical protein
MGIFDDTTQLFTTYHARIVFREKLMGGVPKDPAVIEAWIRTKTGEPRDVRSDELRRLVIRSLMDLGATNLNEDMTYDEAMQKASEQVAEMKSTNGFKFDARGPFIEARQVKAMLKENVNILFAGQRRGPTKKGAKAFLAERVFVQPDKIHLGVLEPTGVEMFVGHVSGPTGPRSTLTYYEYVECAIADFDIKVTEDAIPAEDWPQIWVQAQENGLGALRSQGHGTFDITAWDKCTPKCKRCVERIAA